MKFDPVRIQARDSISETRNSLMSATVGQLSAAFSTRSRRGEFRRNARFPCRQATSATWSYARTRRNEVERDVLPGRAVGEIKMVERLQLFFRKISTAHFSRWKGKRHSDMSLYIFDSSLWTRRNGATSVGTRSPFPFAVRDSPPTFPAAASLLAEARDLSGNKDVVNGEVGRSSRGSKSFHDSLRLRLSPRFPWFEVNCVIHKSKIRLLFHGHNLTSSLREDVLKAKTHNRVKSTRQNVN